MEQADTVMEVFPQLSRDHVIADLRRTGNLNETIRNAMSDRIPLAPPKGSIRAETANKLEIDPKVKEEGRNFFYAPIAVIFICRRVGKRKKHFVL